MDWSYSNAGLWQRVYEYLDKYDNTRPQASGSTDVVWTGCYISTEYVGS